MAGSENLFQALNDPASWVVQAHYTPDKFLGQRIFTLHYADVLNEYVRRNLVILPFEVLATAWSLRARSTRLISPRQTIGMVLVSLAVMLKLARYIGLVR